MKTIIKELKNYTPLFDIYSLYKESLNSVFLDSSLKSESDFSIIGINPYLKVHLHKNILYINNEPSSLKFEDFFEKVLNEDYEENHTGLPIISGAIGYLSYDYGLNLQNVQSKHKNDLDIPSCVWCFYDNFIIEDLKKEKIYITASGKISSSKKSILEIEKKIKNIGQNNLKNEKINSSKVQYNFTKNDYLDTIEKIINYIVNGDVYILNLTQQIKVNSNLDPFEMFSKLRKINPSPYGSYMNFDKFKVISSSPERFIKIKNDLIETSPIKGTRKRGATVSSDLILKNELINSEKDKSELLMIVDLERNDLNKICIPGSVNVSELFTIKEYSTVFHLVSTIKGILNKDMNFSEIIKAIFPGGSITGAPKIRAMEIIDELENSNRGIYTGSIGYISFDKSYDLNIAIRTAVFKDDFYSIGVGGGITYESQPSFEYEETLQKAKALLEAIEYGNKP